MKYYTAYIDEAGDEGFGRLSPGIEKGGQSRWLILGAIIVSDSNDKKLPKWRDSIRAKFPEKRVSDLHWRNLNHDQRRVVAEDLAALPIGIALTLSHKITIPGSKFEATFKQSGYLYNYLVRWLLERLITACERAAHPEPATLHLVFSRRGGTDYEVMRAYLDFLKHGRDMIKSPRRTNWGVLDIDGISVENHKKKAGLQIADCTTSAFFNAIEHNRYGHVETTYAETLHPKLVRLNGTSMNSGLTVVPSLGAANCSDEQKAFFRECWKSGQAPGS